MFSYLEHADDLAPTRQHELDHTGLTDHTDQEYISEDLGHLVGISFLPDV